VAAACGGEGSLAADCDDVVTEELDPTWTVHLLPGAPEPGYLTDPPTSGPHYSAEPATGVVDEPLDDASQVTVLEVGGVLVQYRPADLSDSDRGRLVRLAEDGVVIAPDPDLPDPVVATAWQTKQRCQGVALDTLTAFISDQGGQGPAAAG
jgi:hypothetical protein